LPLAVRTVPTEPVIIERDHLLDQSLAVNTVFMFERGPDRHERPHRGIVASAAARALNRGRSRGLAIPKAVGYRQKGHPIIAIAKLQLRRNRWFGRGNARRRILLDQPAGSAKLSQHARIAQIKPFELAPFSGSGSKQDEGRNTATQERL